MLIANDSFAAASNDSFSTAALADEAMMAGFIRFDTPVRVSVANPKRTRL
ncbi:MAG: hypothetical protein QM705_10440 [Ancrocorticia sp.]